MNNNKEMHIYVADREAGNVITEVSSIEEGLKTIKEYEEIDRAEGTFTERFYDLVDGNRMSLL